MKYLFSTLNNGFLEVIEKKEKYFQDFLSNNWELFFPDFSFIKSEYKLKGDVRSKNDSDGKIDIFAFNKNTNRFVIIELKNDKDKNIIQ